MSLQKQADNVYVTLFRGLSLREYILARHTNCQSCHGQPCSECASMINVASCVLEDGCYLLSEAFQQSFPDQTYKSDIALRRFMQLPVVSIRVGAPESGRARWYLVEYIEGVDYAKLAHLLVMPFKSASVALGIDKDTVRSLLGLAQSNRERELIRYSIFKTSGLTPTGIRRQLGFEQMQERAKRVEECIEEAKEIREAIDKLSRVQDKAILSSFGINIGDLESDTSSESEETDVEPAVCYSRTDLPTFDKLMEILEQGRYNFFVVAEFIDQESPQVDSSVYLEEFYSCAIESTNMNSQQKNCLKTSYEAFHISVPDANQNRIAASLNGDIVSDSESDNPDDYVGVTSITSERARAIVTKKRKALSRSVRRQKAKQLEAKKFLSRKTSKKVRTIVDRFPDIGAAIESYVSESNVGADAWRRTGLLTFDGNIRVKQKVTFGRIQQHLQEKYQHRFSYGTVVQLCVSRNKRRRSSANYKGVAKVTTRRARKGFALRFNPDKHWSGALYRGLNLIEYTDGSDITNMNRDDASGFRLDTLTTHSQHATPAVQGQDILTTYTDYVNRYPSILQTTSYNFTATKTSKEMCVGVVKGAKVYPKNPAQHYADLEMLSDIPDLQSVFNNSQQPKRIECVRVDGATDEGPAHDEVRFWWAVRHLKQRSLATLVSSRSSGASYLNRAELQNGCLARGHSNLFIPSTLAGSVFNPETGAVDMERVKNNLDLATSVYIDRVNNCPCGDTVIHLYKGADSADMQKKREHLMVYLKGSKKKKEVLQKEYPDLYTYFTAVSGVIKRHEVPGLPPQYLYLLVCCFEQSCPHPLCQAGNDGINMQWFPGGPQLDCIPMPVPDPAYPWGSDKCDRCAGLCTGHFLKPEEALKPDAPPAIQPPSTILKSFFETLAGSEPTESMLQDVAKDTLLPIDEVQMWLDHLRTVDKNRKRGAAKAAETRRQKQQSKRSSTVTSTTAMCTAVEQVEYNCGICGALYDDNSDEITYWIGCEECDLWFHGDCVHITPENEPEEFYCSTCSCV